MNRSRLTVAVILTLAVAGPVYAAADADSVATARELYAAAAYDDALALLNRLRSGTHAPEEGRSIDQYRAFCLLALGRAADAEQAIAAVVTAEPLYRPDGADVSPRLRSAFSEVRRKVLPSIIQETYAAAKLAFDRKELAAAAAGFGQVLAIMTDPDVEAAASRPPLADLRILAAGFRDLSLTTAAPPLPPLPLPVLPVEALGPPLAVALPLVPRIYGHGDLNVVPPIAIRQALPSFQLQPGVGLPSGVLEIVVDETGAVESARMRQPVSLRWDKLAVEAARSWRYEPATLDGVPVKYQKRITIAIKR